ncbi:RepB plasmid partition [Rhodanobacter denitrificans]|uniref:RepB plasmid partition n=1 Tax=Rhodanobacter denitrificans TaxID=666685 RepID=A0A368KI49_9GAMM|nr:plasmid partitioning protein RepB C-terminal domain-containing protein [Rhodanobacter denitrificans]RCS31572.1 RepB plasmid partition [Rhodanobacter denitrificans]
MSDAYDPRYDMHVGFELDTRVIPLSAILPLKALRPTTKQSQKYRQIAASIHAIGLVECLVVVPNPDKDGSYFLLDGLLRLEIIKELGWKEVECLISTDDESYTYNKRISRLASIQEHRMIVRAVERGVPEEKIAKALDMELGSIRRRFRLLDGICREAIEQLSDKPCPMAVFDQLKRMKPMRQLEAAELMTGQRNYTTPFIKAILAATHDEQLVKPRRDKQGQDISREQIARLERELEAAQNRTRYAEEAYGEDNLQLTIAKSYLAKLLKNSRVLAWLELHEPEYLAEFQEIAEIDSLAKVVGETYR